MDKIYTLRYLPLFYEDLEKNFNYIKNDLSNPQAAFELIDETEKAILKRLNNPESFEPIQSKKERKHKYYKIRVKNFCVLYVVIGDVMEVRRFVYSRRDIYNLI